MLIGSVIYECRFVLLRVISWIVTLTDGKQNDPRNHTKQHEIALRYFLKVSLGPNALRAELNGSN